MKLSASILLFFLSLSFFTPVIAQRSEDHFLRRRVVNRLDLEEKINRPMVRRGSGYDIDQHRYAYKKGLVDALISALKAGKVQAYHPDDLNQVMNWTDVQARMQTIEPVYTAGISELTDEESGEMYMDEWDTDNWSDSFTEEFDDLSNTESPEESATGQTDDYASYEMIIQFVEDWIFDKNRSDLVYDIKFFEVIWVDPGGALPDKVLTTFKYEEIEPILAQTQWINRFNEAENLSAQEVFKLRLFHSFLVDVSGVGMRSLEEAENWRKKLVEQAHHLYSY